MPDRKTAEQSREGEPKEKAPTTQAGEFIREEMVSMKEGEGAESREQAIAIGLSRARRAGVKVPVPKKGKVSERTRRKAAQDLRKGQEAAEAPASRPPPSRRGAAKKKGSAGEKTAAPGKTRPQKGRATAARRTKADRSAAARKAAATRKKRQQEQQGSS